MRSVGYSGVSVWKKKKSFTEASIQDKASFSFRLNIQFYVLLKLFQYMHRERKQWHHVRISVNTGSSLLYLDPHMQTDSPHVSHTAWCINPLCICTSVVQNPTEWRPVALNLSTPGGSREKPVCCRRNWNLNLFFLDLDGTKWTLKV